ncbi:MAG: hypothetical protein M3506_08600 [Chloroflexota bacterium]|nr:hypothetical protein [Chloroflexota bacterium]
MTIIGKAGHRTFRVVYFTKEGIQPLEQGYVLPAAAPHRPLTIRAARATHLIGTVAAVLDAASTHFPSMSRWQTESSPFQGNRLQVLRRKRDWATPLPGFGDTYVDLPAPDAIARYAARLLLPSRRVQLDALSAYRDCAVLLAQDPDFPRKEVCAQFRPFAEQLDWRAITAICLQEPSAVLARFNYDDDDSIPTVQFYGTAMSLAPLVEIVETLGVAKVESRDAALRAIRYN